MVKLTGGVAAIYPRTGAGVDHIGDGGIDDDREHIRIIDEPLLDVVPIGAAIGGLPGQVPGAGINGVRILGIDGDGLDFMQVGAAFGSDPVPGLAAVFAAEDSLEGACDHSWGRKAPG